MGFLKRSVKKRLNVDMGLLILRIMAGGLMLTHGFGKFMQLIEGNMAFADPVGIGQGPSLVLTVFAEFFCSILIMFGLLTRLATVPLIVTMLVAAFIVHSADPLNVKEHALLFASIMILLFYTGGGKYSLDRMFFS